MQTTLKQLPFADIYTNTDEYFQQDTPELVELFKQYIALSELIPQSFFYNYHILTGNHIDYKFSVSFQSWINIGKLCYNRIVNND